MTAIELDKKKIHILYLMMFFTLILTQYTSHAFKTIPENQKKEINITQTTVSKQKSFSHCSVQRRSFSTNIHSKQSSRPLTNITKNTTLLGTPDQPTIDGGIINAPGDTTLYIVQTSPNHQTTTLNSSFSLSTKKNKLIASTPPPENSLPTKSFSDTWMHSDDIQRILNNAAQTGKLSYVLNKANTLGLPANVALLPIIESQYNDNAISPKGAAGAWQLMPSVASDYGLEGQERMQFIPATNAALMLLYQLHQELGNWDLTFAAYNAGTKRVISAIQLKPNTTNINNLDLPKETKQYIARLHDINEMLISHYSNEYPH